MNDIFEGKPIRVPLTAADIPADWHTILDIVADECSGAVLAGGALRDLSLGVPHVDLDIFVVADRLEEAQGAEWSIAQRMTLVAGADLTEETAAAYRNHFGADLIGVSTFEHLGEKVQVVYLDLVRDFYGFDGITDAVLNRIDFGACRIAFDGETLIERPECKRDLDDGTFTLVYARNGAALIASVKRFERWRDRYPDATLEIEVPIVPAFEGVDVP